MKRSNAPVFRGSGGASGQRRRTWATVTALAAFAWLAACGRADSGDGDAPSSVSAPSHPASVVETDGDESSVLDPTCSVDAECALPNPAVLFDQYSVPTRAPDPFTRARCEAVSVEPLEPGPRINGPQCRCFDPYENATLLGPVGLDSCFVHGRDGGCLFEGSEFTGCDVSAPDACDALCATVQQRLEVDAARTVEVQLLGTPCVESHCYLALKTDERCVVSGQSYDCNLSPAEAVARQLHPPDPPEPDAVPFAYGDPSEIPGVSGTVSLYHRRRVAGTSTVAESFAGWSRFYTVPDDSGVSVGEIIDPLEGADDCGVFRSYGYRADADAAPPAPAFAAQQQTLIDGEIRYADFDRRGLDLGALGAVPRFGEAYAFEALGLRDAPPFRVEGPTLPEALHVETLEAQSRFGRGALPLTWTGRGEPLLYIYLDVFPGLGLAGPDYAIACRVVDDGAFTIPEDIMAAVPAGFVIADFTRQNRDVLSSNGISVLALGTEWITHDFALSAGCERPEVVSACHAFGDAFVAASIACGQGVPAAADLCPDYLAESCEACPEYFECRRRSTRCVDGQLESPAGCQCP